MQRETLTRTPRVAAPANTAAPQVSARNLRIGESNDASEREADRVADDVINGGRAALPASQSQIGGGSFLRRKCSCGSGKGEGECEECKKKEADLQRKSNGAAGPSQAPPVVHEVLGSSGQALDTATRAFMEPRLSRDFSQVRIHRDAKAAESARAVNALAYTVGNHIVFGAGSFDPGAKAGRRLLAHELVHVTQQQTQKRSLVQRQQGGPTQVDLPQPEECEGRLDITKEFNDFLAGLPALLQNAPDFTAEQRVSFKGEFDRFLQIEGGVNVKTFKVISCDKINSDLTVGGETVGALVDPNKKEIRLSKNTAKLMDDFKQNKDKASLAKLLETLAHEKRHVTLGAALKVDPKGVRPDRADTAADKAEYRAQEILAVTEEIAVGRMAFGKPFAVSVATQEKLRRQKNLIRNYVTEDEYKRLRGIIIKKLRERYGFEHNCDNALTLGVISSMDHGRWFQCVTGAPGGIVPPVPDDLHICQGFCDTQSKEAGPSENEEDVKVQRKATDAGSSGPAAAPRAHGLLESASGGLRINEPNDAFEQEADRMANKVVKGENAGPDRSLSQIGSGTSLQQKSNGNVSPSVAPPIVHEVLRSPGQSLDPITRSFMESRLGHDFSRVHIHTDSRASESARAVNAVAYTVGDSIAFAAGSYSPQSTEGRRLLAHELAHTIQQGGGSARAQDAPTRTAAKTMPGISRGIHPRVARQIDPATEAKRTDFEDSVANGHWEHAAEILNGFNVNDIRKMLAKLSEMQAASIYVGATSNGAVGPQSNAANMTRGFFLDLNYKENRQASNWGEAAKYLNGFSPHDISLRLRDLTQGEKQLLLDGAKANPEVGPDSNVAKLATRALEPPQGQTSAQTQTAGDAGTSDTGDAGAPKAREDFARQAAKQAHRTEQLECVVRLSGCGGDRSGVFEEPEVSRVNESCKNQTGYSGDNITPTNEECKHPPKLAVEEAVACDSTPEPEVTGLSNTEKLAKAWGLAKPHLGADAVQTLDNFFSPGNIAMLIGFEVGFAALEATPVGWAADVVAAIFLGQTLFEVVGDLLEFLAATKATNLCELTAAADALRKLCTTAENVAITMALLSPKGKGAGEKPYEAPASDATVDVLTNNGAIWRMPKEAAEPLAKGNPAKVVGGDLAGSSGGAKGTAVDTAASSSTHAKPPERGSSRTETAKGHTSSSDERGGRRKTPEKTDSPSSLRLEDAKATEEIKTPDGEEHEIIGNEKGFARCSPAPCPAIPVVYARELAANPEFAARYKAIRELGKTDVKAATKQAAKLAEDIEKFKEYSGGKRARSAASKEGIKRRKKLAYDHMSKGEYDPLQDLLTADERDAFLESEGKELPGDIDWHHTRQTSADPGMADVPEHIQPLRHREHMYGEHGGKPANTPTAGIRGDVTSPKNPIYDPNAPEVQSGRFNPNEPVGDGSLEEQGISIQEFGKRRPANFKDVGKVRDPALKKKFDYQIKSETGVYRREISTGKWILFPK